MAAWTGVENDADVRAALSWFASASGNPLAFWARLKAAQAAYREFTGLPENFGRTPQLEQTSADVVAAFLAQGKSLLDSLRTYDHHLASKTIPWLKQIGSKIDALDSVSGAKERAASMLSKPTVRPDSSLLELTMAANYADDGGDVSFVDEAPGVARRPDLLLAGDNGDPSIGIELKRLNAGAYETEERRFQAAIFREVAILIERLGLSVHIDVAYTSELVNVPVTYLAKWLEIAVATRVYVGAAYPWRDEHGQGTIKFADVDAVRADIRDSSLYVGPKLARLLSGEVVRETNYQLAVGAEPDERDPRYISELRYGSVVTWESISPAALEKRARIVKAKLIEAGRQLKAQEYGIVHLVTDTELLCQSSDLRRSKNQDVIKSFRPESKLVGIYVHYLVPRVSEQHSWLLDETVDSFGPGLVPVPMIKAFPEAPTVANDQPAWRQSIPLR